MEPLTDRQAKVLKFIQKYLAGCGRPPTLREIAAEFRFASTFGVRRHLEALERKGYIKRNRNSSRGIELTPELQEASGVPIVGRVAAGTPITAIENFDKFVVGTIWEEFKARKDARIMVLPDHATPIAQRTHTTEPVPFAVCGSDIPQDSACVFTESAARTGKFVLEEGHLLMEYLIRGKT